MSYLRNKELQVKLGAEIKRLRTAKGMTLEELANNSEVELSQVHRVETGKVNASIGTIEAIAQGLGVTLGELFINL
jgi:transcriptional regulator with XRE-family HTH domain